MSGFTTLQQHQHNHAEYAMFVYTFVDERVTSYSSVLFDVVVTQNTKAHHSIIKEEYDRRNAVLEQNFKIEFESDSITIDIPNEGVAVEQGWKLVPIYSPVVLKKHVDSYTPGKQIPKCQFSATIDIKQGEFIPQLLHTVELIGAKPPSNYLNFFIEFQGLYGVKLFGKTPLSITNAADKFNWEGYGLTVHIQENSLPQGTGTQKSEFTVAASTNGQYVFPANSNLVSAVYWFHCEPKRNFEKQLMLEIQHCAKSENASTLRFVTAASYQKQLPYNFKPIEGGRFTSRGAYMYGSLHYSIRSLTSCGLAIVQDRSEEKNYYARLFYLSQSSLHKEMNFVITLATDAHITESKAKYEEMNAQIGYERSIAFESDQITLDIPEEGISDHNGWKLLPQAPLAVTKKEVDSFTLGKKTPHCKLLAGEVEPSKSRTLHYEVHLKGAKHPHNVFTLHIEGSENVRRYKAYETALQSGLALNLRYLKFLFFGPPRSGKSTTRRRLVQEIINLHSLGEPSVSTGVTETHEVVIKKLTSESVAITDSQWCSMKKSNEARQDMYCETELEYLAQLFYQSIQSVSAEPTLKPGATNESDNANEVPKSDDTTSTINTEGDSEKLVSKADGTLKTTEAPSYNELSTTEISEVENAFDKLKKILHSDSVEELKQLLEEITLVNMADVGGQPAFLDMVPALTIGPALYLLFFRLDQNLKERYPVRFLASDSKAEITLESYYCIEDVLHQCLASVDCFGCHSSQEHAESASKPQASSGVVLFGTYKDKVNDDKIADVDTMLQKMFAESKLYKEGLLLKSSSGKMFFTVDNMKGTEESEMSAIRKQIEDIIKAYFPPTPVPASWLMFRIVLHLLKKPLVSLAQCKEIAKQLSMLNTVEDALWFFHRNIGSLMHYSNIPSMKDIVICNPQVIFDSVSTLIIEHFQYSNRALKAKVVDEFDKTGQFTLSQIKDTTEQQRSDLLAPDKLVDVLKYHNILVELKPDQQSESSSEPKFIMPSTLKYASEEELKSPTVTDSKEVPPLMISFEGGFVPFGVFCASMAHLIAHQDSLSPKWQLYKKKLMKNIVTFCIDRSFYATLISRPHYLEIRVKQHPHAKSSSHSLPDICNNVRQTVVETLKTVIAKMQYTPYLAQPSHGERQLFHLAFTCWCDTQSEHLMNVFEDQSYGECPKSHIDLDLKRERIWFNQTEQNLPTIQQPENLLPSCSTVQVYPQKGISQALAQGLFSTLSAWKFKGLTQRGLDGRGTVIVILDTAIDLQCPAFHQKQIPIINCLSQQLQPGASNEHGNVCAAVAVGSSYSIPGPPSTIIPSGIASSAELIVYRIAEASDKFYVDAFLRALDDMKQKMERNNIQIDVVSISCEFDEDYSEVIKGKIKELTEKGVAFVAAAGNRGHYQASTSIPACFDCVISVGALDEHGFKSRFNACGRIDVFAPGEDIPSPLTLNPFTGTSFATPAVAGLVSLLKQCANEAGSPAKDYIHCVEVLRCIFSKHMTVKSDNGEVDVFDPVRFLLSVREKPNILHEIVRQVVNKPWQQVGIEDMEQ